MLLAGACSAEESTTPTVELSTTSTPITTQPTTTEPSTTEAPTSTEDPRIAEVEAAVVAARQTQVALLKDPARSIDELGSVLSDPALSSASADLEMTRAEGQVVDGEFIQKPIDTQILTNDSALHVECGLDALASTAADGAALVEPDQVAYLRRYSLQRSDDGRWTVSLVQFEGSERQQCELS